VINRQFETATKLLERGARADNTKENKKNVLHLLANISPERVEESKKFAPFLNRLFDWED
jgi:hypothetical protein